TSNGGSARTISNARRTAVARTASCPRLDKARQTSETIASSSSTTRIRAAPIGRSLHRFSPDVDEKIASQRSRYFYVNSKRQSAVRVRRVSGSVHVAAVEINDGYERCPAKRFLMTDFRIEGEIDALS